MKRRGIIAVALVASLLTTVSALSAATATIEIKFSAPLQIKVLGDGVRVNSNRDYTLHPMPAALKGLKYTQHEHKNPATTAVTVKQAGDLLKGKEIKLRFELRESKLYSFSF
jgi:hypothetical protein